MRRTAKNFACFGTLLHCPLPCPPTVGMPPTRTPEISLSSVSTKCTNIRRISSLASFICCTTGIEGKHEKRHGRQLIRRRTHRKKYFVLLMEGLRRRWGQRRQPVWHSEARSHSSALRQGCQCVGRRPAKEITHSNTGKSNRKNTLNKITLPQQSTLTVKGDALGELAEKALWEGSLERLWDGSP